jgi:hypothetical protein
MARCVGGFLQRHSHDLDCLMNDTRPPAPSTVRSRWTSKDEATLQELTERKKRIDEENREPLQELVYTTDFGGSALTDWLIENAAQLRALLEPFDHSSELAR